MPRTDAARGPRIHYEVEGDADGVPLVLIEGLGTQLVGWRAGFRQRLVAAGLRLVLLDNRDVGLSDKLADPGDEALAYSIDDMADDVGRVLDAAGLASAHVLGQSMGGAIAQSLALRHAARVRSLTLFYTAPVFDASFVTAAAADRPAPAAGMDRATAIAARVEGERVCASSLQASTRRGRARRRRSATTVARASTASPGSARRWSRARTGAGRCAACHCRAPSSTAAATRSCAGRRARRWRRRSRAPTSTCSPAWGTSSPNRCGRH